MNANMGPAGNTESIGDKAGHVLPPGSPRPDGEVLGYVPCSDSILRVFDDRLEVISGVIQRQSVGILYSDLMQIVHTAPVGSALGSIKLIRSDNTDSDGGAATVSFKNGGAADKCLRHVSVHAPQVEIIQNLRPDRARDVGLKAKLVAKEQALGGSIWEPNEKAVVVSKREADRELRRLAADEAKTERHRERDVRNAERLEEQRRLQIERPDGFRKDIWEAKKNVFDPNWMRRGTVRELESRMREGELVESLASCRFAKVESLVVMTNQRLFIAGRGFNMITVEYAYKDINSIESVGAIMTIHAGGSKTELFMIGFQGEPMANRLRERIAAAKAGPVDVRVTGGPSAPDGQVAPADVLDLLAKLANLHAGGVLTDAEFNAKKADLLDRL